MPISRAKPIDQLYEDCAEYDLVIVPDAPLARALNRRLDRPHFGPFATTPRQLAAQRRDTAEDRLAFLGVIDQCDLSWKQIATAVGDTLQAWEHDGRVDAVLSYEGFDTPTNRTVVECISALEMTSQQFTDYKIDTDEYPSVAVVGEPQLTTLDRSILPDSYDTIDPFLNEPFELPEFHIFNSPAAIVETLIETITEDRADDIAVILENGSDYSTLLESAFEAESIPFYGGPGFSDEQDHRCFLMLLRTVFAGSDTRVADVRPLLTHLGTAIATEHNDKRLFDVTDPALDWVCEYCNTVPEQTLSEALSKYEQRLGRDLDRFREELDELDVLDEPLTETVVDQLVFYCQTYEVPIDRDNEGVLLTDPTSAAFVDRPVVFCLGLDEGWTHSAPRRPWIDRDTVFERNIRNFQMLLQTGVEQHYLVANTDGGSPVTPTLYLTELLEAEFDRFSDFDSIEHTRTFQTPHKGFERQELEVDVEPTTVDKISQSSLNSYANSPRDYLFSRLVDNPDKDYFTEGNLFHDFAEFYATHPDSVDSETIDELAEIFVEETQPFHRDVDIATRHTKYRAGLTTITEFLDERGPDHTNEEFDFLTPESGWGANFFAEYFDQPVDSPLTERWFDDDELRLKGKIDLLADPTHLLDFKSGSRKSTSAILRNSALDPPSDTPNYQALLYLAYYRQQRPDEQLQFTFFHFLETLDDVVTGDPELEDCLTTVTYQPITYEEYVTTEDVFDELCNDAANDCNKTFSKAEYEDYLEVLDKHPIPTTRDGNELADSPFGRALTEQMIDIVGDYKYVDNGCTQACRHLASLRKQSYFEDDIDAFERFIDERLEELNTYHQGDQRFPVAGLNDEPNFRRIDHRDLLLKDELTTATDGGEKK